MKWLVFTLLSVVLIDAPLAVDLTRNEPIGGPAQPPSRYEVLCTGYNLDWTPLEQKDAYYGNVLDVGAGGQLSYVFFYHYGWGTAGPYSYNIRLYDWATCTPLAMAGPFDAGDAAGDPQPAYADLCEYNTMVAGSVFVGIEPLTCYPYDDPELPWDCYPALVYDTDYFTPSPPVDGCGAVVDARTAPVTCSPFDYLGPADFILYVAIDDCPPPTAAESASWGRVKGIYR